MTRLGLDPEELDRTAPESWPILRERIAAVFRTRSRDDWAEVFEGTDACVSPILSLTEAPAHPHLAARNTFVEVGGVMQPAPAPRFSRTPATIQSNPVAAGTHTREVLERWGVRNVDALLQQGIAAQS
jgi:alpha-methylacyl-CoA racemase